MEEYETDEGRLAVAKAEFVFLVEGGPAGASPRLKKVPLQVSFVVSFNVQSQLGSEGLRSKYVWAPLPAVALLRLPVASLVDVDRLTINGVVAFVKPKCLVVVMGRVF